MNRQVVLRRLVIGALLSLYALTAATAVRHKSMTFDELGHLTGGTSAWLTGDYRLFPQNGQFPQRWATLPLVALGVRFPPLDQPAWWSSDLEALGHQFLFESGNDHDALLWRARLAMLPLGLVLGGLCYAWARRLFGVPAGLVALAVFSFSPSMLAHGALATSDLAAALTFTAALGAFWTVLHRATAARVAGSSLLMGLLFVTKFSAFVMVPVALGLVAIRVGAGRPLVWAGRVRRVTRDRGGLLLATGAIGLAHVAGVLLVIWASYGFRHEVLRAPVPGRDRMFLGETLHTLSEGVAARPVLVLAGDRRVVPEPYVFGLAHVLNRSGRFIGFLNGRYSVDGWWFFFPYCWLVKSPLGVFALLGLAMAAAWSAVRSARSTRRVWRAAYRLAPLLVFSAVYWAAAIGSSLNLGERHLLPVYPAVFIVAGGAARWIGRGRIPATGLVAAALISICVESARIWPDYLSYFNALAGGPRWGYRHLVDSSLDWGQDLPALARWLTSEATGRRGHVPVYLSYFGASDPAHYGIEATQVHSYQDWRPVRPLAVLEGGTYCISATMLQSVYTRAPGPWSAVYEAEYQRGRRELEEAGVGTRREGGLWPRTPVALDRVIDHYDQLRLARLAAYLRHREPDDWIGYSILVFRLTDEEVDAALLGPPVELVARPAIEGLAP